MAVNGKRENIIQEDLLAVAKQMNIKKPKEIIEKVLTVVRDWKMYAQEVGVPMNQITASGKTYLIKM